MAGRGDGSSGSGTRGRQHSRGQQAGRRRPARTAAARPQAAGQQQAAAAGATAPGSAGRQGGSGAGSRQHRQIMAGAGVCGKDGPCLDGRLEADRDTAGRQQAQQGPGLWEPCGKPAAQREAARQAAAQQGGRQGQRRHNSWRQRGRLAGSRRDHARQSVKGCRERVRAPSLCPSEALCGRNPAQGRAEEGRLRSGPWRAAAGAQLAAKAGREQQGRRGLLCSGRRRARKARGHTGRRPSS